MSRLELLGFAAFALLGACAAPTEPQPGELLVAATVAPHAWLAEQIAGDDAMVVTVLPPTADPHSHTPTDAEVTRLARCRILFRAGVPFENGSWLDALASQGVQPVDLRQGIELLDESHEHSPGEDLREDLKEDLGEDPDDAHADPHTWTSPRRLALQAQTISAALVDLLPQRADAIRERTRDLVAGLDALDAELTQSLAAYRGRAFYVHHPSWSYFAADYGLDQVAIEAGGTEPTDAALTAWLRRARGDGVHVVFVQPQTAKRAPRAVAGSLGLRLETLNPLAPNAIQALRVLAERLIRSWDPIAAQTESDESPR